MHQPRTESTLENYASGIFYASHEHYTSYNLPTRRFTRNIHPPCWLVSTTDWLEGALSLITRLTRSAVFSRETLHDLFYRSLFKRRQRSTITLSIILTGSCFVGIILPPLSSVFVSAHDTYYPTVTETHLQDGLADATEPEWCRTVSISTMTSVLLMMQASSSH